MDLSFALDAYADRPPAPDGPRALLLEVGGDWYGVPLASVRVVVRDPVVTRVPEAPGEVVGVTNVRGEVIPVVDTGTVLGVARGGGTATVAVVQTRRGPIGLAGGTEADGVVLDEDLGESALGLGLRRHRAGGRVVTLLDTEALAAQIAGGRS